ncbi:hypothetical protein [Glutamicibacter protophormiae]|uniref:Immunity repressor n=1 Tax=Glutamicibacter protophormiae TaxID=37930 RepID=A0ABS4XQX3_GLUPR|nr:hypothetical protein [Glutamicibacter protophormiae]MBP2398872.1 hypothetical protein [Glutamicibacter protophormiae]
MNDTDSLKGLIEMAVERHQTSARQLAFKAQEAGLKITYTTLNQIRSNTYKSVPGEQTLRAIAWLAGVEDSVAFTAAGQPVPGPPLADELPPGADNLSPKSRKAVVEMVRVLVDLEAGSNAERTSSEPTKISRHQSRGVSSESNLGQEQKTGPDDSIIEFHGAEAEKYPAPPIEQLAAHPKVKTRSEQLDEESDSRNEN